MWEPYIPKFGVRIEIEINPIENDFEKKLL